MRLTTAEELTDLLARGAENEAARQCIALVQRLGTQAEGLLAALTPTDAARLREAVVRLSKADHAHLLLHLPSASRAIH